MNVLLNPIKNIIVALKMSSKTQTMICERCISSIHEENDTFCIFCMESDATVTWREDPCDICNDEDKKEHLMCFDCFCNQSEFFYNQIRI